jgi:hypothetical protein
VNDRRAWPTLAAIAAALACHPPGPPPVVDVLPAVPPPPEESPPRVARSDAPTFVEMRRVHFRLDPILSLDIARLTGRMRPLRPAHPIDFDDPRSFTLAVGDAEVGIDTTSLARLMNRYVFGFRGAPLADFHFGARVKARDGVSDTLLEVRGTFHGGVPVPFTIGATVEVTPERLIRLHPVDVDMGPIDVGRFMHLLGIRLQELVDARRATGLRIDGNDMIIDPTGALPPPRITGELRAVRVTADGLVLTFRDPVLVAALAPEPKPPVPARNYMYFRGGVLHFGKLFMPDAEMLVTDSAAPERFDFFLDQYHRQLVAGHSQTLPDYGLLVVMQDYDRLVERRESKRK